MFTTETIEKWFKSMVLVQTRQRLPVSQYLDCQGLRTLLSGGPLSSEFGTNKTVKVRLCPWLEPFSGQVLRMFKLVEVLGLLKVISFSLGRSVLTFKRFLARGHIGAEPFARPAHALASMRPAPRIDFETLN